MKKRIIIIDDEETIRLSLKEGLSDQGYQVFTYSKGTGAMEEIEKWSPHLAVLDVRLPDCSGIELLKGIKSYDPEMLVIMITAYGDTQSAVSAIKKGAYDYIEKPFDLDEFNIIIQKAFETQDLKTEVKLLKKQQKEYLGDDQIVGESDEMQALLAKMDVLIQNSDVTVLVTGETGVGKGLIARSIHRESSRGDGPFVEINCGAIPENLIESELFGFEKHAFTGAQSAKKGLFEVADGGTVFLDEIGELPANTQVKLLKFLEERKFKRVGGLTDKKVDVRIIAATNKNLEQEVERGNFREDLFYRLNVVPVEVPPLRKRQDDITVLSRFFLHHFAKMLGKKAREFSPGVMEMFKGYPWPGNVRELRNIIERIVIFVDPGEVVVSREHLQVELLEKLDQAADNAYFNEDGLIARFESGSFSLEQEIEQLEKQYILKAIELSQGNKTRAAKLLGISRFALLRRLEKYALEM